MDETVAPVLMEDVQIIFRNFAGKENKYDREGTRTFAVKLPPDVADTMAADGWNVKYLEPRDEGEERTPFLPVAIKFSIKPPRIVLLTSTSRTQLDEKACDVLDWADIKTADLIVRPYFWDVNGKSGIKAYLQSLFVTIEEDELERKYAINEHPPANSKD